jgi:hypothetical protein
MKECTVELTEVSALEIKKYDVIWHTSERTGKSDWYYVISIYHGRDPELQTLAIESFDERCELEIENYPTVMTVVDGSLKVKY